MDWLVWAVLLLAQNGSATWVSRARNSRSLKYHAVASIASNGVWILSLSIAVDKLRAAHGFSAMAFTAAFYVIFTVSGSVAMHHFLMTRVERGVRSIG